MPKVIHTISKLLSKQMMAFQGDPRTNRIRGKEKPAGPALLILGAAVVSLLHINLAYAESDSGSLTITAEKSLTVTVPGTTNLSIHPTENGAFNTANINIIVNSNNRYGYNLNMTTATTSLTGNAPLSSGNYPVIESISSSGMTCTAETGATCNFTKDKWGYKLSTDTTYSPIQANTNMLIKNNTNESTGTPETSTVTFGARLSNATPAGSYSTTLTFIATINNPTAVGGVSFEEAFDFADKQKYNGYYAMQDMDATICEYVKTQSDTSDINTIEIGELIDKRDNEIYTVGKLIDGKCWMLENLRLGENEVTTNLTAENTNMNPNKTFVLPEIDTDNNPTSYTNPKIVAISGDDKYGIPYGYLYNFCAATAGEYCLANSDAGWINVGYDVCPSNWNLPSISNYNILAGLYNHSYALYYNALRPALAGTFVGDGSEIYNRDIGAYLWSSSAANCGGGNFVCNLTATLYDDAKTINNNHVSFDNASQSIRCLAK